MPHTLNPRVHYEPLLIPPNLLNEKWHLIVDVLYSFIINTFLQAYLGMFQIYL